MKNKNIRIISKIEIKGPNLIKGLQFDGFRSIGKAEDFAQLYYNEGIDELIYQDVVASLYERDSLLELVRKTSKNVFIPLTVVGGIRCINDIEQLLLNGADKVGINTAAVKKPNFIQEASKIFGKQCIVGVVDVYKSEEGYKVWINFGKEPTSIDAIDWCKTLVDLGVGEIIVTIINNDGMGRGYDIECIKLLGNLIPVPLIVCGGAGCEKHFIDAAQCDGVDALCASSIYHYYYANKFKEKMKLFSLNRKDETIDHGNFDFLLEGYGGRTDLMVLPTSIQEIKKSLLKNNISVRN